MKNIKYFLKGFSVLEALIALLIVGVSLLGVSKLQTESLFNSSDSRMKTRALNLAQDKIEDLRDFANQNIYTNFSNGNDTKVGSNATFTRAWTVANCANSVNCKRITVTVTWNDASGTAQTVRLTSDIAQVDPVKSGVALAALTTTTATTGTGSTTSTSSTTSSSTTSSSSTMSSSSTTSSTAPTTTTTTTTTTTAPPATTSTTTTTLCTTTVSGSRQNENAVITVVTPSGTCTGTDKKTYSCTVNATSGSTITIQQVSGGTTQKTATANCENRTVDF